MDEETKLGHMADIAAEDANTLALVKARAAAAMLALKNVRDGPVLKDGGLEEPEPLELDSLSESCKARLARKKRTHTHTHAYTQSQTESHLESLDISEETSDTEHAPLPREREAKREWLGGEEVVTRASLSNESTSPMYGTGAGKLRRGPTSWREQVEIMQVQGKNIQTQLPLHV